MGEVAERKRGRRGSTLRIPNDVIIQQTPQGPLSLGCAEPALPEGEPRGWFRFVHRGYNCHAAERHIGRSLRFRCNVLPLRRLFLQCGAWYRPSSTACGRSPFPGGEGFESFPGAFPTYFNGWTQVNNVGRPNNCQLSIVHCQFKIIVHFPAVFTAAPDLSGLDRG